MNKYQSTTHVLRIVFAVLLLLGLTIGTRPSLVAPAEAQNGGRRVDGPKIPPGMKRFETRYHVIFHDLEDDEIQEVAIRMTAMVEEYIARTREFTSALRQNQKLPFLIFRTPADYYAAGGLPGSAGVFTGDRLMAIAGKKLTNETWHVIQHEGFHQFASVVISGDMPIWVNEGLAEYFGEAIYTGDGFVSGVVPAYRLQRIQKAIAKNRFKSVESMMRLSHAQWNAELDISNYDQAWAMVEFLAHGEDGKYQKAFSRFMILLNKRQPWEKAWGDTFGSAAGFGDKWEQWWKDREPEEGHSIFGQVAVQMLTSYLARGASQKTAYDTLPDLRAAIRDNKVPSHELDALPLTLAKDCTELVAALEKAGASFSLEKVPVGVSGRSTQPGIVGILKDGTKVTGTYRIKGNRVGEVSSKIEAPKTSKVDATKKADPQKKPDAATSGAKDK